ncbi:hypothetical protein BX666DRAFT_1920269 [Dichotomocladium elegans]|nr:hypothetical protein BX666DRAFT_1920269 [Dichotomocladium elegans]
MYRDGERISNVQVMPDSFNSVLALHYLRSFVCHIRIAQITQHTERDRSTKRMYFHSGKRYHRVVQVGYCKPGLRMYALRIEEKGQGRGWVLFIPLWMGYSEIT